jgi:hypothetical protein
MSYSKKLGTLSLINNLGDLVGVLKNMSLKKSTAKNPPEYEKT